MGYVIKDMEKHYVIFDGTSHFVESVDYELGDHEEVVYSNVDLFDCLMQCEELNLRNS